MPSFNLLKTTLSYSITQIMLRLQLAVTLYWMGHCGNAASVEDVTCLAGCGEGLVINYTD